MPGVGELFIRLLSHNNKEILRSVVNIVGHLQIPEAVEPLKTLLFQTVDEQTDEDLRHEVATALGTIFHDIPQQQELYGESIVNVLLEKNSARQHGDTNGRSWRHTCVSPLSPIHFKSRFQCCSI